jgi:hypothetical protein
MDGNEAINKECNGIIEIKNKCGLVDMYTLVHGIGRKFPTHIMDQRGQTTYYAAQIHCRSLKEWGTHNSMRVLIPAIGLYIVTQLRQ